MITKKEANEALNEIMDISNIMDLRHPNIINVFSKVSSYINATPTAEEVCKALSEYTGLTVKIDKTRATIYCKAGTIVQYENGYMKITATLPPHLITLIGKFYEGVIDSE